MPECSKKRVLLLFGRVVVLFQVVLKRGYLVCGFVVYGLRGRAADLEICALE